MLCQEKTDRINHIQLIYNRYGGLIWPYRQPQTLCDIGIFITKDKNGIRISLIICWPPYTRESLGQIEAGFGKCRFHGLTGRTEYRICSRFVNELKPISSLHQDVLLWIIFR
ncbi:hypothetical protein BGC31_13565 [Komagataeibacter xylinus]|nr:hypothetical protein BGC31_13565 [Komagataeibacter xylinus]